MTEKPQPSQESVDFVYVGAWATAILTVCGVAGLAGTLTVLRAFGIV